jgi:hypothetical protein
MTKKYRFFLLHIALYFGALFTADYLIFLAFSAVVGVFPRYKLGFWYYLICAVLAMGITLYLNFPPPQLMANLSTLLGLGPVPFWLVVGLITNLTMVFISLALNRLLLPNPRKFNRL